MSDVARIAAMKTAFESIEMDEWLTSLKAETELDKYSQSNATSGVYYDPEYRVSGVNDIEYGGFFAPIEALQRDEAIQTLFNGEGGWLIDYLDHGDRPGVMLSRDPQKEAFINAYDRLMVGFLDARRMREGAFNLESFLSATRDQTLTDTELYAVLAQHGFLDEMEEMGPELSRQWVQFAGGVLQGVMDYERRVMVNGIPFDIRFEPTEFNRILSPKARQEIEQHISRTHFPRAYADQSETPLHTAVLAMEAQCATAREYTFTPPAAEDKRSEAKGR